MSKVFTSQEDFELYVRKCVSKLGYRCDDGREFCVWDLVDGGGGLHTDEQLDRATDACLEHIAKLQREGY